MKQGYELQIETNNLAHFLFTKLLAPLMPKTVRLAPKGSVRVVWVASSATANFAPEVGVVMGDLDYRNEQVAWHKYGVSKAGNILHGKDFSNGMRMMALSAWYVTGRCLRERRRI